MQGHGAAQVNHTSDTATFPRPVVPAQRASHSWQVGVMLGWGSGAGSWGCQAGQGPAGQPHNPREPKPWSAELESKAETPCFRGLLSS